MKVDEWTSEDVHTSGGGEFPPCAMHFRIYDKASGVLKYAEKTSSGSYGGCVGLKDGRALVNTGQSGGPIKAYRIRYF